MEPLAYLKSVQKQGKPTAMVRMPIGKYEQIDFADSPVSEKIRRLKALLPGIHYHNSLVREFYNSLVTLTDIEKRRYAMACSKKS